MESQKNKPSEEPHKRLNYILAKVEWDREDMEWMLTFLENGGEELMKKRLMDIEKIKTKFGRYDATKMNESWLRILSHVRKTLDK